MYYEAWLISGGDAMPVHDWTRVDASIFHHFRHDWITEIARALNRGLLPPSYYALADLATAPPQGQRWARR